MDASTPKAKSDTHVPGHSHLVRPTEMEWQKSRFPGCESKRLFFDTNTGLITMLMRFAPGAVLPEHEHVQVEQTYVLEGRLIDKEGPAAGVEVGPGEFIWREVGSRHVVWCPEGALMLAIFQVPNKFIEADGRVTDAPGNHWHEAWGHTGKG
jgi:anti-sigma factor ChrR (cupin superfamily)